MPEQIRLFSLYRYLAALTSALVLAAVLAPGGAAAETCTPTVSGVSNVTVGLIRDAVTGDPVLLGDSTQRREHARVSSGLAQALGLTVDPNDNVNPEIRVVVSSGTLASGLRATANFTAVEVFNDAAPALEVYAENRDPGEPDEADEDSGYFKLFEEDDAVDLTTVSLTVYPMAPSATTTVESGATTIARHFCEPAENGADGFEETVTFGADKDFVLIVPHGGEIEAGTSEQMAPLTDVLSGDYGVVANVWETAGSWDPSKLGSEHFHITSKALDPATFPGLGDLMSRSPFAAGQPFRYAASLHGFGKYAGNGLVFGGDAHPETKCFVARAVQQRLSDLGLGAIAYYVYDDDGNVMADLPDERDVTIPEERGSVGLTGSSSDNIVNRLSPNPGGAATGVGGMQIEESVPLRQDAFLRDLVARQIAHAFGALIDDPSLLDPASTAQCDALAAGPAPPAGAMTGRVWLDGDEDGVQDPGELGVAGIAVDLLADGATVDSTATDADGDWAFTGLVEAGYAVRVTAPAAHGFGPRDAGGDDAADSDVDPASGESDAYPVTADGANDVDLDASLVPIVTAEIGDRAWIDADGNGVQDLSEPGLPGVVVTLLDTGGSALDQTTTDASGLYAFTLLPAGDYRLRFAAPAGYGLTGTGGGTAATDSDPDPATGETGTVSVGAGQVDDTRDAGFTVDCYDVAPVAFGSTWKVSDDFDEAWTEAGFSESGWQALQAVVGYGSSSVVSSFTPDGLTAYFRLTFEVAEPSLFDSLDLALFRDDGAAVYLNGTEVLRSNLPAGTLGPETEALDSDKATVTTAVDANLLQAGPNVLAVEVHNQGPSSADLLFDLELRSRVCRPCLGEATIPAGSGTYIKSGDTTANGGSAEIQIDNDTERSGLIAFPVAGAVPPGAEVLHAEVVLWIEDGSSHAYRFYPVVRDWDEAAATYTAATGGTVWETDGAKGATDRDQDRPVGLIDDVDDDVLAVVVLNVEGRALIEEWAADSEVNHGLIVPGDDGATNDLYFASDNDTVDPVPTLKVVYAASCGG